MTSRPFDFLNESIGKEIMVQLKGNITIRGTMKAFDQHMNIALEGAEELVDNEVKRKFGKIVLRGDTVVFIAP